MIQLDLRTPEAETGGTVAGTVSWSAEGRAPEAIEVALRYRTEGRGTEDSRRVAEQRHELDAAGFGSLPTISFRLDVPPEGPVSYDGDLIRVIWEVTARLDIPWARDEKHEVAVWVGPAR